MQPRSNFQNGMMKPAADILSTSSFRPSLTSFSPSGDSQASQIVSQSACARSNPRKLSPKRYDAFGVIPARFESHKFSGYPLVIIPNFLYVLAYYSSFIGTPYFGLTK
jgi:hypothetical protein